MDLVKLCLFVVTRNGVFQFPLIFCSVLVVATI